MNEAKPSNKSQPASPRRWLVPGAALIVVAGLLYYWIHGSQQDEALLRATGSQLQQDKALLAYADNRAQPIYKEHCASCHGADLKGDRSKGIPNLGDGVWLYGTGQITDIEQTILYGIRSGHPKSHNLADMPAMGRINQLTKNEIQDVVEYVQLLSKQPHDEAAAERGRRVYENHGVCYDCHASDGYGVSDYGTPSLTGRGGSWLYGGDRDTLYKSVFDGRHGLCPAWVNKLSFAEIRALSAFLYQRSQVAGAANKTQASLPTLQSSDTPGA
ncbi:MAG: c-type cytochrome [Steroidobacteraceae bacterium]